MEDELAAAFVSFLQRVFCNERSGTVTIECIKLCELPDHVRAELVRRTLDTLDFSRVQPYVFRGLMSLVPEGVDLGYRNVHNVMLSIASMPWAMGPAGLKRLMPGNVAHFRRLLASGIFKGKLCQEPAKVYVEWTQENNEWDPEADAFIAEMANA